MAGFYGCLKIPDDPTMDASLREVSAKLEVLEANDEGKKKSKFKAFKNFFGKKKRKEPEGIQRRSSSLKPSSSNSSINDSSLNLVQEVQQPTFSVRRSMSKSLSHESIFMLESEPESPGRKIYPSPELQSVRSLERSVSRTLSITSSMHRSVSGSLLGVRPHYVQRSGIWIGGSKITEIPPLRARHSNIDLTQSDTISQDCEEIFSDDESPKTPRKKNFSPMLTMKKSSFEPPSIPMRTQSLTTIATLTSPSSPQLSVSFSTPATSQGCLDSSAARHKMALNPRKQKKYLQATMKSKQEDPGLPLVSGENTKPKAVTQKKLKDIAGPSNQEQSIKTEIYKTTDQAANADAAESQGCSWSAAYGKRRGKKEASVSEKNECGSKGRSFKQPSRGRGLGNRAGYPSADKIAKDSPFCHFSLETQVMKQPRGPQVENITPQELLSDENDTRRRLTGLDFKTRKASMAYIRPNDRKESMASGPSQYLEDEASGTKKSDDITSLSSMVENSSKSQEDTIFSVTGEAQVHMDPSHIQSEEEEASSFDTKSDQFEMKSAQDSSTICKEKPSGNVIQAFPTRVSDKASALTEGRISVETMPPRSLSQSLGKPEAEGAFLDSDSISEVESGSDQQLTPGYVSQSPKKPKDEELLSDLESASSEKGSGSEQEPDPKYSFQPVKSKDDQEAFPDSNSVVGNLCNSHEQLAARCVSQALEEPEDKVPTESNSNSAKYSNPKDLSSSEGDMPPKHPSPVLEMPTAQKEILVSKKTLQESVVSMEQTPPRNLLQPSVNPSVQQQLSSDSGNAFSEWVSTPPMNFFHSWLSPASEEQASAGQASIAPEWGIFMEPLPPRKHSRHRRKHKIEQPISSSPEISIIEGTTSTELKPSRNNSQLPVKPIAEQEISAGPETTAVKGSISMEPPSPNILAQPRMNPTVEQSVFLSSEGAGRIILMESKFPDCLTNLQDKHDFLENTAYNKDIFVEPLYPNFPGQPQTISSDPWSAFTGWSDPVVPPRHKKGSRVITSFEQQPSASPGSTAVEWGNPREPLPPQMPSQSLRRPVAEQEVSGLISAPKEWSGLVQRKPSRYTLQPWASPKFEQKTYVGPETLPPRKPSQHQMKSVVKQPTSAGPKSVAIEGDSSTEQLPPRHWSIVRHKIQKMMPTSENAAVGCISERPLPIEYPTYFSKPNIQEISLHTENPAVEGSMSKKSLHTKCPSQSFVKFMAQHVFSESPNVEEQVYVDPLSSNQPSKYLLRSTVEQQAFLGCESADIEGGISSKLLPTKCPSQFLGRPEDPQGVFSYSENAPVKCSYPQEQLLPGYLSQAWGKLKYEQEVSSVSESSLKEWKSSEEQLPSKCHIQAEDGAEFQPQISSTGSVSVPVERISAENRLPARHPFQGFTEPQYKHQVYSSSTSAAAKGAISESNPSSWSLPRGPASPNKTRGHSQDSEDLFKDISTPATKSVKFTLAPAWPPITSGDTYSKEDVLESSDQNNDYSDLSTSEADVENLFGVRLKRIPSSQKYKSNEQNNSTTLPSLSLGPVSSYTDREPQIRSASQGLLGITKNLTTTSDVAEKQKSKPKSDSMPKKKPDYKIPGKAPGEQSGSATSEPPWITMVKQKQKNFPTQVPTKELKTKNEAGAKAGTKVPRNEGADLAKQSQQREISTSNTNRQQKTAQIKIHVSTKAVVPIGYENEKIIQMPDMGKETRQSSAHPAMFKEPDEPIWFSMAKKKAKAWRQITETMQ